ncbi:glycerol-3-phosphate acyltransferase [Mesoplasma photuris]|uniref:glycerol-3-phosphate acyltransferase n=1 Tax=Mesoplasma photuris TaxID=217731 RepID=UPI000A07BAF7|nr:glycerol-3-phosphate acyltransferase [Mesoplasma photuris]
MFYLGTILACIVGYFIGGISWSIVIVNIRRGIDVRTTGSGNAGATNTTRLIGKGWGFLTVVLDGFKVVITSLVAVGLSAIPNELFSQTSYFIPAIFVLIGHCFPIYYKFKGGKAVSCFLGLLFVINYLYLIIFLIVWFSLAALTRKVSIASIAGALVVGALIWIPYIHGITDVSAMYRPENLWNAYDVWNQGPWEQGYIFAWFNAFHKAINQSQYMIDAGIVPYATGMLEMQVVVIIGMSILAWRHFPNMKRIKAKTEPITFEKMTPEEKRAYKNKIKLDNKIAKQNKKKHNKIII